MEYKHSISVSDTSEFLRKYVDIFSSIGVDQKFWLAKKEKSFFIKCVEIYNQGIDIGSPEAIPYLAETLDFKTNPDKGVYIYRGKLRKKGWLTNTDQGTQIPSIFDLRSRHNANYIKFDLSVSLKKPEDAY